ncbi:heavy metal translocating P-type ATPase [Janthinobacterium sp. 17J80-10]|uniref:heavy metal translocating P-type ATPase n=1 Tax=Janthinobacterium sp. 17J80-10 TaxID=2497863 RepID=UPI001F50D109|nr:heavy metal translocating P-type ATPase [Janthinobacterium sp. 17J80-10]
MCRSIYLQTGISAALLLVGGVLRHLGHADIADRLWLLASAVVLTGALIDTFMAILRREIGLDVIALLSIGGAIALQEYFAGAVIALMYASGRTLEQYAENRARREMSALLGRAPRTANRYEATGLAQVSLEAIQPGDRILVRAGDIVPIDGQLLSDVAAVDESALTGESLPVSYAKGSMLASGIINAADAFDMLATRKAEDSTYSHIVHLVEKAQQSKAPVARLADRYAVLFIPLSLGIAGIAWLATGDAVRALAVIVVATPCPLILAVPVALFCAMSRCAQHGVLIKHGSAIEQMAQVKTLFFDKTGTLTGGKARLSGILAAPWVTQEEVLRLAASLEQMSSHAIAQAIVAAAHERGLELTIPTSVTEEPGAGLAGRVGNVSVAAGTRAYVSAQCEKPAWPADLMAQTGEEGNAAVCVAIDGKMSGLLQMADEVRLDTPRAMRLLRAAGIGRIVMLTGDRSDVADAIGGLLGVDKVMAQQTPASKQETIALARADGAVMMVGDGINDAPALAAANVGVAMGARGAAAAAESAQLVLLVDRLDRLASGVRICRKARAIAIQSAIAGMGLSVGAMLIAAFGYLPPVAGAILQEAIDVAVILNALRVLRLEKTSPAARLPHDEVRRLNAEHARLVPIIDRIRRLADRISALPPPAIAQELLWLNDALHEELLPHESSDERHVYPRVASLIGGDDPLASMSTAHREIFRLGRKVETLARNLLSDGQSETALHELRHLLYALEAILRLHFCQEEEMYHNLSA